MRSEIKPSRIPTPESTSRPLPPLGYVADGISLLHTQCPPSGEAPTVTTPRYAQHPPNEETPFITPVQYPCNNIVPPAKPPKTITVEFRATTTTMNEKQPSKASCEEHSNPSVQSAIMKPKHSMIMNNNGRSDSRKKQVTKPKANTGDKHKRITKQTKTSASFKAHSSWGGSGRMNELRIRLDL